MAYEEALCTVSLDADSSIAEWTGVPGQPGSSTPHLGKQYHFVKVTGRHRVGLASAAVNEVVIGVLQSRPQRAGHAASIATEGVSNILLGADLADGVAVKSDSSGQAVAATPGGTVLGVLSIGGKAGSVGSVILLAHYDVGQTGFIITSWSPHTGDTTSVITMNGSGLTNVPTDAQICFTDGEHHFVTSGLRLWNMSSTQIQWDLNTGMLLPSGGTYRLQILSNNSKVLWEDLTTPFVVTTLPRNPAKIDTAYADVPEVSGQDQTNADKLPGLGFVASPLSTWNLTDRAGHALAIITPAPGMFGFWWNGSAWRPGPVQGPPVINALETTSGPAAGGTAVRMYGRQFDGTGGPVNTVTIGGVSVPFTLLGYSALDFVTPAHAPGPVDITVTVDAGVSGTQIGAFTYT